MFMLLMKTSSQFHQHNPTTAAFSEALLVNMNCMEELCVFPLHDHQFDNVCLQCVFSFMEERVWTLHLKQHPSM